MLVTQARNFPKGSANQRAKRLLGNGLLTADTVLNSERRKVIQPAFARLRLEALAPAIVAKADAACAEWSDGSVVDLTREMGRLTFDVVGEMIVGARVGHLFDEVREAVDAGTASLDPLISLVAPLRGVERARARLHVVVKKLMSLPPDDRHDGTLLSRNQQADDVLTILLAGHDTITSALTWTWLLLASHDEADARMRAELTSVLGGRRATADDLPALVYTRAVFAESLRLYPPAWVLARQAVEAHRFAGGEVTAGAIVLVSQFLLHRDRRSFDRPEAFAPERWFVEDPVRSRRPYFPFGAGSRSCIGESFAWMESVLLLATIAQRWRLGTLSSTLPAIDVRITLRPRGPVLMRAAAP